MELDLYGGVFVLLGILLIAAAVASVAVCVETGAFTGLGFLWLLPVSFAASFAVGLLLAVLFFAVCCSTVDIRKPRHKDSPFFRFLAHIYIDGIIRLFRIRVHTRGMEQLPKTGRFFLVCNHLNDADPALLLWQFHKTPLAFITKQENYKKPLIAQVMHGILCQSIDRENNRQGLEVVQKCIDLLQKDLVSVAAFPEGYVSRDKKLHPFRNGVFKVALRSQVPIVVCTLRDSHRIFPNMIRLKPTDVQLHLVGVIGKEELQNTNAVAVGKQVYEMMAADLGPDLVADRDA